MFVLNRKPAELSSVKFKASLSKCSVGYRTRQLFIIGCFVFEGEQGLKIRLRCAIIHEIETFCICVA